MSVPAEKNATAPLARLSPRQAVFALPNQLTWARLGLTVVLLVLLSWQWYLASLVVFVVAVGTDWLDGYLARRLKMITTLGRILDPFADKLLICGVFVYLAADSTPSWRQFFQPWMAVVVLGRELLVTALRSFLERQGKDFSARWSGKLKMVFQSAAAGAGLFVLHQLSSGKALPLLVQWITHGLIWTALALTVYSGVEYIRRATSLLGELPSQASPEQ